MYPVLEHLMRKANITKKDISDLLVISYGAVLNKFEMTADWKYSECEKIRNHYFPGMTIDDLFKKEI